MKDFLHTLIKPDWDDNPKRSEILNAANLLQIGEFQLIQLAYKIWFKENLPENKINKIFVPVIYLLDKWVAQRTEIIQQINKFNKYLVINSIPIVGCFFSNLKPILSLQGMSSILHLALIPSTITSYSL